jgi:DNA-binding Lrp family transcriptional regulator
MKAYILIEGAVGRAAELVREVGRVRGVRSAHGVTGAYDVIAHAEAASLTDLGDRILAEIATIGGITRTLTCPVLDLTPSPDRLG